MSLADVLDRPPLATDPRRRAAHDLRAGDLCAGDLTAEVAMRWACTPRLWQGAVQHVPGERWYLPLFETEHICGWLITWAPGTALDLHDHGGAEGSVVVVAGTLVERFRDRRRVEPFATRQLTSGSMVTFTENHVHEVRNVGDEPAVSIHVYAPTLAGMTFYEEDEQAADIRPARAETVAKARANVRADAGGDTVTGVGAARASVAASTGPQPRSMAAAWLQGFR
jgi:quercetin dioxygenase-like cupin family protein